MKTIKICVRLTFLAMCMAAISSASGAAAAVLERRNIDAPLSEFAGRFGGAIKEKLHPVDSLNGLKVPSMTSAELRRFNGYRSSQDTHVEAHLSAASIFEHRQNLVLKHQENLQQSLKESARWYRFGVKTPAQKATKQELKYLGEDARTLSAGAAQHRQKAQELSEVTNPNEKLHGVALPHMRAAELERYKAIPGTSYEKADYAARIAKQRAHEATAYKGQLQGQIPHHAKSSPEYARLRQEQGLAALSEQYHTKLAADHAQSGEWLRKAPGMQVVPYKGGQ